MGISSAYGDINNSKLFYSPGFDFEATFKKHRNMRWSWVCDFLTAGLTGDSKDFKNVFPDNAHYKFNSRLWQLGFSAEFNFFNYGWGYDYKNTSRLSPFISAGAGLGVVTGDGKSAVTLSVPIGAGIKYKFAPRWNATVKMVFGKMISDKADGVEDPFTIKSDAWKNTDWYSTLSFGITYEFGAYGIKCNNLD